MITTHKLYYKQDGTGERFTKWIFHSFIIGSELY
jgi:hypothetical protein